MRAKQKDDRRNVLAKIEKQYENEQKPVIYEYKSNPSTVPQRKFGLIIARIKDIIENGMKPEFLVEDQDSIVYWEELAKAFKGTYEMDFVSEDLYGRNKQKLKEYLVVLLSTHRLFETLEAIGQNLQHMYSSRNEAEYQDDLSSIKFLRDGRYEINCELVANFNSYRDERREKEELERRRLQKIREEKQRAERVRVDEENRKKREEEDRRRQLEESLRLEKERNDKAEQDRIERERNAPKKPMEESWMPETIKIEQTKRPTEHYEGFLTSERKLDKYGTRSHLKNSERLYEDMYKDIETEFTFAGKPTESTEKVNCFNCKKPLGVGIYIIGYNLNYCHYTGEWYCNDCIAAERISVPWKALESFDLRGYNVCQAAFLEIKSLEERPILKINNESQIVETNQKLFNFLILKREIHLMYDSICNTEFIERLLKHKLNYCLQINLFSLKNLYDIYNGQEEVTLGKTIDSLRAHFYQCKECQKKGYKCKSCNNPVRIFPFELRTTKGCSKCRKLYHRVCFQIKGCLCSHS